MDKYEYKLKLEEIDNLTAAGDYRGAAGIADEIDWGRESSFNCLNKISKLYAINRRYDDAINLLMMAREKHPSVKQTSATLCELAIKKGDVVSATEFFKEFSRLNPDEFEKLVLQYKYQKFMGAGIEERIAVLERICDSDYTERWSFELAKSYDEAGETEKCVDECDQIALWFGDGKFVLKALELKMKYAELTDKQKDIYFGDTEPEPTEEPVPEVRDETGDTRVFTSEDAELIRQAAEEQDNLVKTVDVSEYNTINLQAVLAEEISRLYTPENDPVKVRVMESMQNTARLETEEIKKLMRASVDEEQNRIAAEEAAKTPVEVSEEPEPEVVENKPETDMKELFYREETVAEAEPEKQEEPGEIVASDISEVSEEKVQSVAEEAESSVEQAEAEPEESHTEEPVVIRGYSSEEISKPEDDGIEIIHTGIDRMVFPDRELSKKLAQDDDGQISFVYPETDQVEKQIPGQINLDDIMREWERMKRETKERQVKEVKNFITRQTDKMFNEFEASVRDGLLEKIERGEIEVSNIDKEVNKELGLEEQTLAEPEYTEEPEEVAEPEYIEEPEEAAEPEYIEEPEEVAEPEYIEEPEEAAEPEYIEEPEEVTEPEYTEEPEEVTEPEYTEEPEEVAEPEYTKEPEEAEVIVGEAEAFAQFSGSKFLDEALAPEDTYDESATYVSDSFDEAFANGEEAEYQETAQSTEAFAFPPEWDNTPVDYKTSALPVQEVEMFAGEASYETEELTEIEEEGEYPEDEEPAEEDEDSVEELAPEPAEVPEETEAEEKAEPEKKVSEDKKDDILPKNNVRLLTDAEEDAFFEFLHDYEDRENLVKLLDTMSLASYTGNIILMGDDSLETINLSKKIVTELKKHEADFNGKVIKVAGRNLNGKNISEVFSERIGGAIIIQKASGLMEKTIKDMLRWLNTESKTILIILEDNEVSMKRMLSDYPELGECFNARMKVTMLNNKTLVSYAQEYAKQKEFVIDDMGLLALHERIAELQAPGVVVRRDDVEKLVDKAIRRAERFSVGHFFKILVAKRYDADDMIIITEKDFK